MREGSEGALPPQSLMEREGRVPGAREMLLPVGVERTRPIRLLVAVHRTHGAVAALLARRGGVDRCAMSDVLVA
jgi:hypothetical protein